MQSEPSNQQRATFTHNRVFRWLFFLIFGLYIAIAFYSSQTSGPAWDDEIEWIGLQDQIAYAVAFIRLRASADFESAIATNLEYYGIINKIAGYWLHGLVYQLGLLRWAGPEWQDSFTGPVALNRLVLIAMFMGLLACGFQTSRLLQHRRPIITPLLMISLPALAGHSWMNIKDIPFALAYSLFTLTLTQRLLQPHSATRRITHLVMGALAVGCRPTFAPVALLSLGGLHASQALNDPKGWTALSLWKTIRTILVEGLLLMAFSVLLLPVSWSNPVLYFIKTIRFHAHHPWGGCMLIFGSCRSVGPGYSTVDYLRDWLSVQLPVMHLLLAGLTALTLGTLGILAIATGLKSWYLGRANSNEIWASSWLGQHRFVIAQLMLVPVLAIISNANTYDGLRHWLFSLSALCILANGCTDQLSYRFRLEHRTWGKPIENGLLGALIIGCIFIGVDSATLAPYSYAYINELHRHHLDHRSIDLDYWGLSSKATSEEIARRHWRISNIMDDGSAEHIYYSRIFLANGRFPANSAVPAVAIVHKRFLSQAQRLDDQKCKDRFSLDRQQLFGKPLNIASVGLSCKPLSPPPA